MADTCSAEIAETPPLTVEGVTGGGRQTPGNVGVCLSGGGSRACSAAMGQLRALKYLQANGESLLAQVKAISTVSGGSWLAVPFTFLPNHVRDDDFLNVYVPLPGDLVRHGRSHPAASLDRLPPGNMGARLTSRRFSIPAIAVQALLLFKFKGTPPSMLWQTLMGMHLLEFYGMYEGAQSGLPTGFFTADQESLKTIRERNPSLSQTKAEVIADGHGRTSRPYLICNTAMFVRSELSSDGTALAPVQATPWFTGIVSHPNACDAARQPVGGGWVTSFAFNSELKEIHGSEVRVQQSRQWSLTDIVGASSAAFAGEVENILTDPTRLIDYLMLHFDEAVEWIGDKLGLNLPSWLTTILSAFIPEVLKETILARLLDEFDFRPGMIIPTYNYWPVRNASPRSNVPPSQFADGGNLENTGICGMLAYSDIDSIIAFVNSATPMTPGSHGVIDELGDEISGTRIIVDRQIPPLFGYQKYQEGVGYLPYPPGSADDMSRSRVFAASDFPALLQGLWEASRGSDSDTVNARPATLRQVLVTQQNDWFGVTGGRSVAVVWCYLNEVSGWQDLLSHDVQTLVSKTRGFPHYRTLNTDLSATEINLLAHQTAWCVAAPGNSEVFTALFQTTAAVSVGP